MRLLLRKSACTDLPRLVREKRNPGGKKKPRPPCQIRTRTDKPGLARELCHELDQGESVCDEEHLVRLAVVEGLAYDRRHVVRTTVCVDNAIGP